MDALVFVGLLLAALFAYMVWKLGSPLKWPAYFRTETGRGIIRGIILAPALIMAIGLLLMLIPGKASAGDWLTEAGVYAGIDYTKKLSPMCDANQVDDRGTSNLGARVNVWRSESRAVLVNSRYTHHSCALGSDNRQYDAIGLEVEWRVWSR
jgi:hypothetical protein